MAKIIITHKKWGKETVYLKDETIIFDFVDFLQLSPKEKKTYHVKVYEKEENGKFMIHFKDVKKIDSDSDEDLEPFFIG